MIVFPNCKINLGLYVVDKRPDGYHNLQTVFFPVPFQDMLEIIPSDEFHFHATGLTIPGDPEKNLCIRAWELLKHRFPKLPPVDLYLHKIIPMGGGLGGGSSNGSFMLIALNRLFQLGLTSPELQELALQLGSDCPFFIVNEPVVATGRGEHMQPTSINLNGYTLTLIMPGIHVSTAQAFAGIRPHDPGVDLANRICEAPVTWKDWLVNNFEETVFPAFPAIRQLKEWLYAQGAVYASMTGTGSTVYGLFQTDNLELPPPPIGDMRIFAL
jgi:4-diphosphocytidyl-2-C-methyl-D-erythritol kinase